MPIKSELETECGESVFIRKIICKMILKNDKKESNGSNKTPWKLSLQTLCRESVLIRKIIYKMIKRYGQRKEESAFKTYFRNRVQRGDLSSVT